MFDATPKLVTWNKAMLRLLDFPESLVRVGTPFEEFVRFNVQRGEYSGGALNPAEVERLVTERMAAVRAFQPHQAERTRPNGQVLSIRGVPIPNLGFVTLWTDITEQRPTSGSSSARTPSSENRVRARTAELEAAKTRLDNLAGQLTRSEERMRRILDTIPAMIAYVDAGERYRFANRGYANWFGLDQQSVHRRQEHPRGGRARRLRPGQAAAREPYTGEQVSYQYSRITPPASRYARSAVVPEASEAGGVQGFFVLSIDITEQKAGQAVLIQAQKMEAVAAHRPRPRPRLQQPAHHHHRQPGRAAGQVPAHQGFEDYLDPALPAAHRRHRADPPPADLLAPAAPRPAPRRGGRPGARHDPTAARSLTERIAMRLDLPTEKLYAAGETPTSSRTPSSTWRSTPATRCPTAASLGIERGPPPRLGRAGAAGRGARRRLRADQRLRHRHGMAPEILSRVFEPFFTTKSFGTGSGLGLSMVYGFIRQSGGNIRILSTPGKGTNVRFILPMTDARPAPPAPVAPAPPPPRTAAGWCCWWRTSPRCAR